MLPLMLVGPESEIVPPLCSPPVVIAFTNELMFLLLPMSPFPEIWLDKANDTS
jgi:hypothetical protein